MNNGSREDRAERGITARYIFALALIAVLSSSAYFSLKKVIETEETSAALVNISGRQRMLSQRIAYHCLLLTSSGDPAERERLRAELLASLSLMERSHTALLEGDAGMSLPGNPSPALRSIYFSPPEMLDQRVREYLAAARSLAESRDFPVPVDDGRLAYILDAASQSLLSSLDRAVKQYQEESETTVAKLRDMAMLETVLILLVLLINAVFIFRPMTKRIREEKIEILSAEQKLRSILESVGEGIVALGRDGKILFANREAYAMFGYAEGELSGESLHVIAADDTDVLKTLIEKAPRGPEVWTEITGRRKDGYVFPLEIRITETPPVEGNAETRLIAALRDISARKRAEQALEEKTELITLIHEVTVAANGADTVEGAISATLSMVCAQTGWPLGHAYMPKGDGNGKTLLIPTGMWYVHEKERFSAFIRLTEETTFVPGEGLPGRVYLGRRPAWITDISMDDNFPRARRAMERNEALNIKSAFAFPVLEGEKVVAVLEFFSEKIEEPDDLLMNVVANLAIQLGRVTERKRSAEEMRRFKELMNRTSDALFVTDPETARFVYVNNKACESLGYTQDEMLKMRVAEIEEKIPTMEEWRKHAEEMRARKSAIIEGRHVRKDGISFPVEVNITYVTEGNRSYMITVSRDITERKAIENALKESEEKFRGTFEHASVGMGIVSIEGIILRANRATCEILGYSQDELAGKNIMEITHPEDVAPNLEYRKRAIEGKTDSYHMDKRYIHKDGHIVWVSLSSTLIHDLDGKPLYYIAQLQNITERKKAEEALKESEERYRQIVELSPEGIAVNVGGRFVFINSAGARLLGADRAEEIMGKPVMDFIHPDYREMVSERIDTIERTSAKAPLIEEKFLRLDGSAVDVEVAAIPLIYKGEKGIQILIHDITERKQTEETLRKLNNAIEQTAEMVLVADAGGVIEYANPAVEKITGYKREEIIGKDILTFNSRHKDPEFYGNVRAAIKSGKIWHGQTVSMKKSGQPYDEEMTISPVQNSMGKITHFVAIKRDISEKKILRQQLIQAEKLSSIGTFVSGVAHELNNPLTAVVGFSERLRAKSAGLPPEMSRELEIISDQARRTVEIVRNLLRFSRKYQPGRRPVNLNEVLERTISLQAYRFRSDNIEISTALQENLPRIMGDSNQLQQVFINILLNAHHEMMTAHGRGKLRVKTEGVGEYVSIAFENDGPSIPQDNFDRIFDPFYTSKEVGEGTGLGLYVSYGIVEEHSGKIWAENMEGGGVRFVISLPVTGEKDIPEKPKPERAEISRPVNILFAEDEETTREWMGALLRDSGMSVSLAQNGMEALDMAMESQFDVILSDIKMPEMNGVDFARHLFTRKPEYMRKFIFMTGVTDMASEEFCRKYGCVVLNKPIDGDTVIRTIQNILTDVNGE